MVKEEWKPIIFPIIKANDYRILAMCQVQDQDFTIIISCNHHQKTHEREIIAMLVYRWGSLKGSYIQYGVELGFSHKDSRTHSLKQRGRYTAERPWKVRTAKYLLVRWRECHWWLLKRKLKHCGKERTAECWRVKKDTVVCGESLLGNFQELWLRSEGKR